MMSKLVALLVVATLVSGSLAVALPLTSSENSDGSSELVMYDNTLKELPKKNGMYIVKTGETVYLQLKGISDDSILMSGTTENGETEVLIHYSNDAIYNILYSQVMFVDGDSVLMEWVVGDFNGDMVYDPNDPNDAAIACNTTGVVMYGKVTSVGLNSYMIAAASDPDFVGYCEGDEVYYENGTSDDILSGDNVSDGDDGNAGKPKGGKGNDAGTDPNDNPSKGNDNANKGNDNANKGKSGESKGAGKGKNTSCNDAKNLIQQLIDKVRTADLDHKTEKKLIRPLEKALKKLCDDKPKGLDKACKEVDKFVHHLNKEVKKGDVSNADKDEFLELAEKIRCAGK